MQSVYNSYLRTQKTTMHGIKLKLKYTLRKHGGGNQSESNASRPHTGPCSRRGRPCTHRGTQKANGREGRVKHFGNLKAQLKNPEF